MLLLLSERPSPAVRRLLSPGAGSTSGAGLHADPVQRVLAAALDVDCPTEDMQRINDDFERTLRPALVSYPGTAKN